MALRQRFITKRTVVVGGLNEVDAVSWTQIGLWATTVMATGFSGWRLPGDRCTIARSPSFKSTF